MATIEINESALKNNKDQKKKGRKTGSAFQAIFVLFCVGLLAFSLYQLAAIFMEYRAGDQEYDDLQQYVLEEPVAPDALEEDDLTAEDISISRIDLASLQELNPEVVGWITIPDTVIDYPILHTTDNTYYLDHTFLNESNKLGAIFIEAANNMDLSDLHTIIYGHNMKNGSMFGELKSYKQQSYYEEHPYVYIDLEDGSHCYEIFSCYVALVTDITYTIDYAKDQNYASFLNEIVASSLYDTGVEVGIDDLVITLSTCANSGKDRFVVHAKKIY